MSIASFVKKRKLLSGFFVSALVLFLFISALQILNYGKISKGTQIGERNLSGLDFASAKQKMEEIIAGMETQPLEITYGSHHWSALPGNLGVTLDRNATFETVRTWGHHDNLLFDAAEQTASLLFGKHITPVFSQDEQKLADFIDKNLSSSQQPAKNAFLRYDAETNDFVFVPAEQGVIFDRQDLKRQIAERLQLFDKKPIALSQIAEKPVLIEDKNGLAEIQAKKIIANTPYYLNFGSSTWPVEKQVLIEWFSFVSSSAPNQTMAVEISQEPVSEFLSELAPSINREAIDAKLTVNDDKVVTFALSQSGLQLEIEQNAKKISQEILSGNEQIDLLVKESEPKISSQTIDTLGLTSLLGIGTSSFAGSPKNRVHNIGVGAEKINGFLVKPGDEFSFISAIGEIGAPEGYLPELVIKDNKTVPEYGGGLCQVSTTLFRAAINAGLKITERYPHAFPVKYYNPQGFDATIYPPHPDLRFINDTPANILIQSKIKGSQIIFEIYGTKDSREVKVIGPTILESNKDGSMKTVLYQEVWRDGILERKSTFRSNYKSPALYPVAKNPLE